MQQGEVGLRTAALAWRMLVGTLASVMVVLGTAVGNDTWWPFAPMSQYAFLVKNDGVINSPFMQARNADGELVGVALSGTGVGLERSEMEGQLPAFIRDPSLMQAIAILHHRRAPDEPRYLEIFLRNRQTSLGEQRTLKVIDLASWVVENPQDPQNWSGRR
ncbi:hypothetical protein [Nostocoides sp.]|jgi:hypothetical protein|uniref:hypothetical protein n=1 Tax=Nostocoides sp. TaxID=1917966 RepID=UPI002C7D65D3|nr:hypothetical protein [Tetrasphaera sp.]